MIRAYKYKNKTFYFVQLSVVDHLGRRHQPRFRFTKDGQRISSERTAKSLEFQFLTEYKAKLNGDSSQITFEEWHEKFIKMIKLSYKLSTVQLYDSGLKKWLSRSFLDRKLSEFNKTMLHEFIFEELESKNATTNTKNKIKKALSRIFETAIDEGLITRNPIKGIKVKVPPPVQLVLNTQEVEILLREAKVCNHPFYYHFALALLTGMRNGELYSLRWRDIDLVTDTISIHSQWTNKDGLHSTKSNRNRIIPISKDLKALLIELRNIGPFSEHLTSIRKDDGVFDDLVLPRSSEWRHGEQAKITKKFCEAIGITPVKYHDLRATFITNMLCQGVSLPQVMALVGHSRTETTNVYLRLAGVNVKGATEKLGYSLPEQNPNKVVNLY